MGKVQVRSYWVESQSSKRNEWWEVCTYFHNLDSSLHEKPALILSLLSSGFLSSCLLSVHTCFQSLARERCKLYLHHLLLKFCHLLRFLLKTLHSLIKNADMSQIARINFSPLNSYPTNSFFFLSFFFLFPFLSLGFFFYSFFWPTRLVAKPGPFPVK